MAKTSHELKNHKRKRGTYAEELGDHTGVEVEVLEPKPRPETAPLVSVVPFLGRKSNNKGRGGGSSPARQNRSTRLKSTRLKSLWAQQQGRLRAAYRKASGATGGPPHTR